MLLALVAVSLAGCLGGSEPRLEEVGAEDDAGLCGLDAPREVTLWLRDLSLVPELPEAGATAGNGFDEAFLTNELDEWTLEAPRTFRLVGDVSLEFWARGHAMPAPIVLGGDPGEGYHFFNQFGTDRGFVESYAVEYAPVVDDGTTVRHYRETFAMPEGGVLVESGDTVRLLLTNLVLDEPGGRGPDILWGGETPSALTFTAVCEETPAWTEADRDEVPVSVATNQGLLTGAVPAEEGVNYALVPFMLHPGTDRLTITLEQAAATNPTKDDMDLTVLDGSGDPVWSIGSPYTDEVGTRWRANLDASMPPGDYTVRVDSYSGTAYEGTVTVVQHRLSG